MIPKMCYKINLNITGACIFITQWGNLQCAMLTVDNLRE